ncbi:MAG: hypothetical protein SOZ80_00670 [Prevotella sp.]|uniref:PG1828 family lipoprotein n=1 Tax=Prevotella sp. TaxID=59823 RepID=UPI002A34FA38|nr:hypothetical protein [Prevotella sp.]MDD7318901.1 hypothetical protein [Prevotellaceae bacterium]MDY4019280.1 hypothetical protein [Prevotella sp.]
MKKLVLMFVAIAAISFASCTDQKANQAPANTDSAKVDPMNDSVKTPVDSTAKADSVKK